jgi:phosphoesterase RecJ-like protein
MISSRNHGLFRELIDDGRCFVLTTHMNPDGDALGSQIALARHLSARAADVRIINSDRSPENLRFLEAGAPEIEVFDESRHADVLASADVVVLLDNSAPDRLGTMEGVMRASADRVLCIDHHPTRETPWAHEILDESECATACIVYDLIVEADTSLDPDTARALFVGLATDTGFFRFNSTTPRAFEIAAVLMRAGVNPAACYQEIYERNSPPFTRLLGEGLARMHLDAEGEVASIRVTQAMVDRCGAEGEDTSEMTTALLAMDRVRVAILFREVLPDQVKVSLRSKGNLDVRALAMEFGGGGHRNASGIVTSGGLDEVAERVVAKASELVRG